MDVIKKSIFGLFVFFALVASGNCFAQKKSAATANQQNQFYFERSITLDSLTKYVHNRSKIRFSFNSSKVKGDKVIYLKKGTYTLELLLQEIRKNTSLYYSMYNGYVIFQDNPPKQKAKPPAAAKKKSIKPPAQREQVLSHRKPVAGSKEGKNTLQPRRGEEPKPITNTPPEKINIAPGQSRVVDTISTAIDSVVYVDTSFVKARGRLHLVFSFGLADIDSVVHADTAVTNKNQQEKSSHAINASVAPVSDKEKERGTRRGLQSKRNNTSYGKRGREPNLQYGLRWKATLPLYGSKYYFTGANNRSQPYNLLIPGIWLSNLFNNKHEVLLMVKPAEWYFYNDKAFSSDTGVNAGLIDTLKVRRTSRLLKTSDLYAGLQYNYHINENWMVGAGIGYHRRGLALFLQETKRLIDGVHLPDTLYSAGNDTLSQYLAKGFITGKLEVAYSFRKLDLGATLLAPVTNPFTKQSSNQSRPINWQIFLRWRIKRTEKK